MTFPTLRGNIDLGDRLYRPTKAERPATLGVGGVLHDFAVAVLSPDSTPVLVASSQVTGQSHGIDAVRMESLFENELSPERAVGKWILTLKESAVVGRTIEAALDLASVSPAQIGSIGYTCPEILLPSWAMAGEHTPQRVNRLDAHAAGTLEAAPGEAIFVVGGTGDRGPGGLAEASALYTVRQSRLVRHWTAFEPASLGVLLDAAAMLHGYPALHREGTERLFTESDETLCAGLRLGSDGYTLSGIAWREMVHRNQREAFLDRKFGSHGPVAVNTFAQAAITVSDRVMLHVASQARNRDVPVWVAGEGALHHRLIPPDTKRIRRSRLPGDDGAAIGAARLVNAFDGVQVN